MKEQFTLDEVRELEHKLTKEPNDSDKMNALAIAYLSCREVGSYNKAYDLFRKAFEVAPSVKTATNYAYQIITDEEDYEGGIDLLQVFVDREPKSFMPYNLIAYAFLHSGNYQQANLYFEKANTLSTKKRAEILHNLALSENHLGNTQRALSLYEQAIAIYDEDNESKFNKALCQVELGQRNNIDQIIQEIIKSDAYKNSTAWVSCTDLAQLSYLNGDMKQAYELFMQSRFSYDLLSFPELCYLLLKYDDQKLKELTEKEIKEKMSWIAELNNPEDDDYDDYTEEERRQNISELNVEISKLKNLRLRSGNQPILKATSLYKAVFCGCMLYDCKQHGTPFDDE